MLQFHCVQKRPVSSIVEHIVNGAGGPKSRADQFGQSVANGSPPLPCFFGANVV